MCGVGVQRYEKRNGDCSDLISEWDELDREEWCKDVRGLCYGKGDGEELGREKEKRGRREEKKERRKKEREEKKKKKGKGKDG